MLRDLFQIFNGGGGLVFLVICVFQVWMFIDALRRREYLWAVFILFFSILSTLLYFFMVYRAAGGPANPLAGFELPGAADRRQIKSLQASIHNLDKAHLHLQLADIYFSQGRLEMAETSYRAAYERDPQDEDVRAHLGNCLAREEKTAEALPLLQSVCADNPKHDYGYTLMTLAETLTAAGQKDAALATWQQVLGLYSYSRARVQYAQLLVDRQDTAAARKILQDVVSDEPFLPKFQRKREAIWLRRAKSLLRSLPSQSALSS